jgi:serine O-acetyltransferase
MISDRATLERYLAADLWYTIATDRWRVQHRLTERALYYQRLLRHAEYWSAVGETPHAIAILATYKVRLMRLGERVGITIPRGTVGPGLSIAHPGGIVVNGHAVVGDRCRISQGVTIGSSPAGAPCVGDDVFFGPNAQAIGAVTIGAGVTVLPGAVVASSVPDRCVVGGVPARVISEDAAPWHVSLLPIPPRPSLWT